MIRVRRRRWRADPRSISWRLVGLPSPTRLRFAVAVAVVGAAAVVVIVAEVGDFVEVVGFVGFEPKGFLPLLPSVESIYRLERQRRGEDEHEMEDEEDEEVEIRYEVEDEKRSFRFEMTLEVGEALEVDQKLQREEREEMNNEI